jgi:hypothetical protein
MIAYIRQNTHQLRKQGINNRRSLAIARDYLTQRCESHKNLALWKVRYSVGIDFDHRTNKSVYKKIS